LYLKIRKILLYLKIQKNLMFPQFLQYQKNPKNP
jgi:hypothetical protein